MRKRRIFPSRAKYISGQFQHFPRGPYTAIAIINTLTETDQSPATIIMMVITRSKFGSNGTLPGHKLSRHAGV